MSQASQKHNARGSPFSACGCKSVSQGPLRGIPQLSMLHLLPIQFNAMNFLQPLNLTFRSGCNWTVWNCFEIVCVKIEIVCVLMGGALDLGVMGESFGTEMICLLFLLQARPYSSSKTYDLGITSALRLSLSQFGRNCTLSPTSSGGKSPLCWS